MTSRRLVLIAVVLATVGLVVLTAGPGRDNPATSAPTTLTTTTVPVPSATPVPASSSPVPTSSTTVPAPATSSAALPAAPPLRQRPQLYPAPGTDPATVIVVPAPQGPPTAAELSTATAATAAWAARWCEFTSTDPLGAAEERSQPAMTPAGWASFDPRTDPVAVGAWSGVTAGGLSGTCTTPDVGISPEAPSSPTATYVTVTLTRLVTSTTGPTTVETVTDTRLVLLVDGSWLVDTPASAG